MRLYEQLVRRLYKVNWFHSRKMGLTNIDRLHRALGSPIDGLPAVHIAGTNGKGSVALKIARSLQLGGMRTGLYTSPHVSCFRERVQVDGELISEEGVENLLPKIFDLCESQDIPATFFEITTALAFQHFRESRVDAVVVETGLGGRLDATNIMTPSLSIITSVGLEHTKILGNTAEEIAGEKAGIIKPGIPVLVGEVTPVELLRMIAQGRGAPFHRWMEVLPAGTPPPADFDEENARLAEAGLRLFWRTNPDLMVGEDALLRGISQRPPCRFEVIMAVVTEQGETGDSDDVVGAMRRVGSMAEGSTAAMEGGTDVTVVLDVAHNLPAVDRLLQKLQREFPTRRLRFVVALSSDKDARGCLRKILRLAGQDRIHVAEASTHRAVPASALADTLSDLTGGEFDASRRAHSGDDSVRRALRDALASAARSEVDERGEKDLVVVCGTVFMMTDARQELGFNETQDSPWVAEVAGSHLRAAQESMPRSGTHS